MRRAGELRVTFINHSTVLLQMDELNLLTDPIWSMRCSPLGKLGPRRARSPGLRYEDLPQIHAVVVSHDHYDHLDLPTLTLLEDDHQPCFILPRGNGQLLRDQGFPDVIELDWWEWVRLPGGLQVNCVPAQHHSGRGLGTRFRRLWGGFVIERSCGAVYFAGDTGYGLHFGKIRARFGSPRLALLPIGAYKPRWLMKTNHMTPEEAVKAHEELGAMRSLAIHHGTFPLGDDGETEAQEDLVWALHSRGLDTDEFWILDFGEGRDVGAQEPGDR